MGKSFFNTTNERGSELIKREISANTQEYIVLNYFKQNPEKFIPAHEVHQKTLRGVPLTSARRCLSNLKNSGVIEKTTEKVDGPYGKPVYTYKLIQDN